MKQREIRFDGFKRAVPLFSNENNRQERSCYFCVFLSVWRSVEHPRGDTLAIYYLRRVMGYEESEISKSCWFHVNLLFFYSRKFTEFLPVQEQVNILTIC